MTPVHENGSIDKACDVTTAKPNHVLSAAIVGFVYNVNWCDITVNIVFCVLRPVYLVIYQSIESLLNMVWRCVVYGCGNIRLESEISVHEFPSPSAKKLRAAWTRFVQRTRDKWRPTSTSYICSEHFVDDNFHNKMQYNMGLATKLVLKKDAVPTIYPANVKMTRPPPITSTTVTAPMRTVVRKREAHRVSSVFY